jgi:hypothetical protein
VNERLGSVPSLAAKARFAPLKNTKKSLPRGMLPKGKALFLYEIADYAGKFSALYRRSSAFAACLH